jgi:hypothetical protein
MKESAVLGIPGETTVPLDGDHRTICRFPNSSSGMLKVVLNNIRLMTGQQGSAAIDDQKRVQFIESLQTSNPEAHKSRNEAPVQGTCTWLLSHPTYLSWFHDTGSTLLWLSADPGCGKSVLASFLVDRMMSDAKSLSANICYFFFKADYKDQKTAVYALQALLHQLCLAQRTLSDSAITALHGRAADSVDALWDTFIACSESRDARNTICILDGLDECEAGSRKQLVKAISTYFSRTVTERTRQISESMPKLKMVVFSRPENSIKVAFDRPRGSNYRCSMIRLRGEDEPEAISRDVRLVVSAAISDLEYQGVPREILEDIESELVSRADRTFLWVTLIIQLLKEKVEEGASEVQLQRILRSRDIDSIYAELLAGRTDAISSRKMLRILLAATRALSVEELGIALAVVPEHQTLENSDQPRRPGPYSFTDIEQNLVYPFENHIKSVCGHFIRIIRNRVYFVHETAREFLLEQVSEQALNQVVDVDGETWLNSYWDGDDTETINQDISTTTSDSHIIGKSVSSRTSTPDNLAWQHSFSLLDSHALLLEICVTFIYCMGKRPRIPATPKQKGRVIRARPLGEPSSRTSPFLDYAAEAWMSHFAEVREQMDSRVLPYYQNLCHPAFPGFVALMSAYFGGPDLIPGTGNSEDERQDHLVRLFKIHTDDDSEDISVEDAADELPSCFLVSNPATVSDHRFQVRVNDQGFVSLNFASEAESRATPKRLSSAEAA